MENSRSPGFFVPEVDPAKMEEVYATLAEAAYRKPLPISDRIYSITWRHNGEIWTATVGQQLHGYATKVSRSKGHKVEREVRLSNSSVVLAIFPGVPYTVWHNGASAVWANPFLAGEPMFVQRFSLPTLQN